MRRMCTQKCSMPKNIHVKPCIYNVIYVKKYIKKNAKKMQKT